MPTAMMTTMSKEQVVFSDKGGVKKVSGYFLRPQAAWGIGHGDVNRKS